MVLLFLFVSASLFYEISAAPNSNLSFSMAVQMHKALLNYLFLSRYIFFLFFPFLFFFKSLGPVQNVAESGRLPNN